VTTVSDRHRYRVAVLAVFLLGVATRTLPLWRSPLPFKADGLFYASYTAETVGTGAIPLASVATDDLGFTALLAAASLVTGVDPWSVAQPVSSLLGALPVLLVVALARRVCGGLGWPTGRTRAAALVAGTFLAVEGLYLHRSMAADEQTAGLFVVPLALVALYRAARTDRTAWWTAGLLLLVLLPPLHNLEAVVALLALSVLVAFVATQARPGEGTRRLAAVTAAAWVVVPAYHLAVERYTPAAVVQESRLTAVPGLVVAWIVAAGLVVAWLARAGRRTRRLVGWSAFAVLFGLIALNATRAVFPEMPRTPPAVLLLLLPLALPAALAAWRGPVLLVPESDGPPLVALGAAATAVVGVSLTAALTPEYLGTAWRTSLFLHVPVAVPVGLGTAAAMESERIGGRRSLRVAVAGLVVASALVSVPLSFGGLAPFTYRAVTPPGELAAAGFATTHVDGAWTADDHTRRVAAAAGNGATVAWTPLYGWLVDDRPPPDCPALGKRSWTTRGTQFVTTGVVRLPASEYRSWRDERAVVYDAGGRDRYSLAIPADGGGAGC
jgi:hypothetical protein